ncbi:hypothetical protein GASC598B02_001920, partial [Gilliamella apicola SCGC AB-598-B02]
RAMANYLNQLGQTAEADKILRTINKLELKERT